PRDGEARNESSGHGLGLVGAQDREADVRQIPRPGGTLPRRRGVRLDPLLPSGDVLLAGRLEALAQALDDIAGRRFGVAAEAERQYKVASRLGKIDLPDQRDVAALCPLVFP